MKTVWDEIEKTLTELYCLPHNRVDVCGTPVNAVNAAKEEVERIRSGLDTVTPEDYHGRRVFLRVIGDNNQAYRGAWWFDASILDELDVVFSRTYFSYADRNRAVRDMLREVLAVSEEWNTISEVWALELPAGEMLRGYYGPGNPQKLFANLPLTDRANRMLVGKMQQVYFPVKNPLWVHLFQRLDF